MNKKTLTLLNVVATFPSLLFLLFLLGELINSGVGYAIFFPMFLHIYTATIIIVDVFVVILSQTYRSLALKFIALLIFLPTVCFVTMSILYP